MYNNKWPFHNEMKILVPSLVMCINCKPIETNRRLKANETIAIPVKDILAAFERKYRVNARQEIVAGVPAR